MKRFLMLFSFILLLSAIVGCSNGSHCYTSNDACVENKASCALNDGVQYTNCGTCECIFVDPLAPKIGALSDAKVGESYINTGTISASGGIPPYVWSLQDQPDWLAIDPNTGVIRSKPGSVPNTPSSEGLKFTVVLKDSSVKGSDYRRDNKGFPQEVTLKITDCNQDCVLGGPTKCEIGKLYHCELLGFGNCTKWVETSGECTTNSCQTKGTNANVSCCDSNCGGSTRCNNGYIEKCSEDALGCLSSWIQQKQCPNQTECKDESSCKDCINECTKSGDRQCSSDNNSVNICEINLNTGCLSWILYDQCTDNSDKHCLTTGCSNGQCNARYIIQSNGKEVLDTTTNLIWKREIEPGTYTWAQAKTRCSEQRYGQEYYRLPSIAKSDAYAEPNKAELDTLIEKGHLPPYINTCAFPFPISLDCNTNKFPYCAFWSSSIYQLDPVISWGVDFRDGSLFVYGESGSVYVRCVRSGP